MKILPIVGGWYGENLPSGEYAVAVPGQGVETHQGFVPNPPNSGLGPLYVRITNIGRFAFAGQPHDGPKGTLYWDSTGWGLRPEISYGVSGHIFDQQGVLRILEAGPNQTSQGYRYVARDGRLVLGDETYTDPARQIWEWTEYDGITIGQGEQGAIVLQRIKTPDDKIIETRYLLEPGDCRFIRFNKTGNDCAVTIVKLAERRTILKWFTVAEIASLPVIGTAPAPNPPPPDPGHPAPPKEPPVSFDRSTIPDFRADVERANAQLFNAITRGADGAFSVTNLAATWMHAKDARFGVLEKTTGNQSRGRSVDIIAYRAPDRIVIIDVIAAAGGDGSDGKPPASLTWAVQGEDEDIFDLSRWKEPYPIEGEPEPEPKPTPNPPPPADPGPLVRALLETVTGIAATLDAVGQEVADTYDRVEALDAQIREIARRLGDVQEQQYQALDGRVPVFGGTVVLTPRRAKG